MSTIYHAAIPVDLAAPSRQRIGAAQFFMGDNDSHVFTALVADTDAPEAGLRAGTVAGTALRADGVTVALEGTKGAEVQEVTFPGGVTAQATPCSVTLPQAAFAVPGSLLISIKLTEGTTATTVLAMTGTVVRTETDAAVDPGEIIPDLATLQTAAAQALEAAEAATAAASSAVRYDTAQSLTDAQQAQARGNIAAASLIPDGTAFSQAVQGGTTYDVQDARVAPLDERVNALHNLVNYGYDIRGYTNGILKSRIGTTVVIDGHTAGTVSTKVLLSGAPYVHLGGVWPSALTTPGITLTVGHKYRLHCTEISGTRGGTVVPRFYPAGTFSFPSGQINTETDSIITYNTTDYPNGVFAALAVQAGKDYSDYTVQVIVEDITDIGDANIAPIDTPTATNTHQPGDLLTMGGTLYKATQAIAPGAVITPGTNVASTNVAAQLAERDTAIAGRAKSGAIAGSLPSNPSVGDLVMDSTGDLFVVSEVDTPNVGDVMLTPTTVAAQLAALAARIAALEG